MARPLELMPGRCFRSFEVGLNASEKLKLKLAPRQRQQYPPRTHQMRQDAFADVPLCDLTGVFLNRLLERLGGEYQSIEV